MSFDRVAARRRADAATEVLAAGDWATNGDMIVDVARLGYLDDSVLDATYGDGGFWTRWRPDDLTQSDLFKVTHHQWDYRDLPVPDNNYDSVVFDPPYKLNGTPSLGAFDTRYGIDGRVNREERHTDIVAGALECGRVATRYLLVKCMDQVEGGKVRWQTDLITRALENAGARKVDRFDLRGARRPQPPGRRQVTARRNTSTLLVFGELARLRGEQP